MSLEQALAAHTAALEKNTAAVQALHAAWAALSSQAQSINTQVAEGKVTAVTIAGETKIPVKPAPNGAAVSPTQATADVKPATNDAAAATDPISYDVVSKAITDGVKSNRDHVLATLAKFSVKKGPELKPEQYADFLAALKAEPEAALA